MEKENRLPPITRRMTDESTARQFTFTFYCDHCGTGFRTRPIPFSVHGAPERYARFTPSQKLIWKAEHEDAYERGNRSALVHLPPCEACGKHICEDCAGASESETLCPVCERARTKTT